MGHLGVSVFQDAWQSLAHAAFVLMGVSRIFEDHMKNLEVS